MHTSRALGSNFCCCFSRLIARRNPLSHEVPQICFADRTQACSIGSRPAHTAHTARHWKALANPKLAENESEQLHSNTACEDGTDAVPHSVLLSHLNACKTVAEQINTLCMKLSLSDEDNANRKAFCKSLADMFEPYLPDFKVHLFGSSMNGFGFKGCDTDVCLQTIFDDDKVNEYAHTGEVPTLEDVLSNRVSRETVACLHPKHRIRFIRRMIRKHSTTIREPIIFIKGRCPILRFYDEKFNVFCDFSCENRSAINNTKLLRLISKSDERIEPLIKVIRYWGKYSKFVGDREMFNSYAFSLLVVFFLQNTNPPVLPPLKEFIMKSDYITKADLHDDEALFSSLKNIPGTKNKQKTDELLREFFFSYLDFDFDRVMLPLVSASVLKQDFIPEINLLTKDVFEFGTISMQDPFRHSFNTTSCAIYKYCKKFLTNLIDACVVYQSKDALIPQRDNWGLSALIESSSDPSKETNSTEPAAVIIDLDITSKVLSRACGTETKMDEVLLNEVASLLKGVLEYGLLFKCKNMFLPNAGHKPFVKLQCDVMHNIWVGRSMMLKERFANSVVNSPLELEHLISVELSRSKSDRFSTFRCVCECCEVQQNGQVYLRTVFSSPAGKLPPVISVFLKEFVPDMLNKLL